jgi:hypothetical protein
MTELFDSFDTILSQAAPKIASRPIDLLPFAILNDGNNTIYCMMRLDPKNPIVYCANGTKLPPLSVTESFLATQPQFNRSSDLIAFLSAVFQNQVRSIAIVDNNRLDCELDPTQFDRLYQQYLC